MIQFYIKLPLYIHSYVGLHNFGVRSRFIYLRHISLTVLPARQLIPVATLADCCARSHIALTIAAELSSSDASAVAVTDAHWLLLQQLLWQRWRKGTE